MTCKGIKGTLCFATYNFDPFYGCSVLLVDEMRAPGRKNAGEGQWTGWIKNVLGSIGEKGVEGSQ